MNLPASLPPEPYYPVVENDLIDDPTPKDQAIYIPSVSASFAMAVHGKRWKRDLPKGVGDGDLNFLDPQNKLMRLSHVMSSAGQALDQARDCIITTRDRRRTLVLGDSGGYQIATKNLIINGDADRMKILRWLEANADVAMTLDVPTAPVGKKEDYLFSSSKACLTATLEHLDFFRANRKSPKVRFLNVLHGNTMRESDAWYDAVKGYEFEGWAFAGLLRHNFYHVLRRVLIMADEGQLQNKTWIHILGTCQLDTAICLTALQRAIHKINPNLRISYDTSSPFRNLAFNNTYSTPRFDRSAMVMPTERIPDGVEFVRSQIRWPWPSALGDRMVMGDICVKNEPFAASQRDTLSSLYIAHHNLDALCSAITLANRVFDSESIGHKHTIALNVGAAVEAIEKIMSSGSMAMLSRYRSTLEKIRHDRIGQTDDEDREVFD